MIAHLSGSIIHQTDKFLVVDVAGVGYKVHVTTETAVSFPLGVTTSLWIYTAVRETSIDLYGFNTTEEMSFFTLLLDVSGIGPKSALSILSLAPIETLKKAIATGDTSYLNKVSGIGRKTAEKIVVELRDKLQSFKSADGETNHLRDEGDVIEALKTLGYTQIEARNVLKEIPDSIVGTNDRIKKALQILGGH